MTDPQRIHRSFDRGSIVRNRLH